MSADHLRRLRNAFRTGPWLALSIVLMPAMGGATEPSVPAEHSPVLTAKPRIGRIFFSPTERRGHSTPSGTGSVTPNPRITSGERLVVTGVVSSLTQAHAVWINGAVVENSAAQAAWTDRNGNVWLSNGTQGTHLVKPGQSIDRSGTIEDLLPPGSITRH